MDKCLPDAVGWHGGRAVQDIGVVNSHTMLRRIEETADAAFGHGLASNDAEPASIEAAAVTAFPTLQAELEARVQELRRAGEGAAELSARIEELAAAETASRQHIQGLEQRLQEAQAQSMQEVEEARTAGQEAAAEASQLRELAAQELALAR